MAQPITVQVLRGDQVVSTQTFDRDIIKIGRLQSAHLRLEDLKVARIHAVIELTNGGRDVSIIDMGSSEGTFLNGEKVQKGKLKDKDTVTVGETKLLIHFGMTATAGAPAPQAAVAPAGAPAAARPLVAAQPDRDVTVVTGRPAGMPAAAQPQARAPQAAVQATVAQRGGAQAAQALAPQVAAQAAPNYRAQAAPQYNATPTFDRGAQDFGGNVERISHSQLNRAAIGEADGLEAEQPMSAENRCLEMRMYWGDVILDINHLIKPKQVTIGETKSSDIFITSEGLPREEFPLIRYLDDQYVLTFFNDLEGEVEADGQVHALRDLKTSSGVSKDDDFEGCYRLVMKPSTRAIVHWGGLTLAMRFPSRRRSA